MKIAGTTQNLAKPNLATVALTDMIPDGGGPSDAFSQNVDGVYLYNKYQPQTAKSLSQIRLQSENPLETKALTDLPALSADGLTRTHIHYLTPEALNGICEQRQWEQLPDGTPVADVIVVGAGPGGLAASYHLAQKGARVVTLESGYAAQAFSDAGAASVHAMRTDRLLTSLVRTGRALEDLATVMGLPAGLGQIVAHAAQARHSLFERTGHRVTGLPEGVDSLDRYQPAARAELFEHFQEVANYIGDDCPNSLLLEQCPVAKIERKDGLFVIEGANGHKICAKKLVMATGLVQEGGANSKSLPVLQKLAESAPEQYLSLNSDSDLNDKAADVLQTKQWIISDRLLGRPEVRLKLHEMVGNSKVAVVGSGESAIKAALEVLSQNPTLKVELYTKSLLEAAQVQLPGENFHPVVLEHAIGDANYGKESLERFKEFDTPVTPRSLIEALEHVASGRLQIHELGSYFDESSVAVKPDGKGGTSLEIIDPKVKANLNQQSQEWAAQGLKQTASGDSTVKMVIQAAGYSREKLKASPLTQQLIAAGVVDAPQGVPLISGLVSSACPDLAFNSASVLSTAADSAIPGMAVRGRQLAELFAAQLPQRELPPQAVPPENPGADWANGYSDKVFKGFVHNRGLAPNWVESQGKNHDTPEFHFPDPERFLRELDSRDPKTLSVAEHIVLKRAHHLRLRMGNPE
jgi:hypothetical protein